MIERETILGQVVAKANNYKAVPDKCGGKRTIKSDARQCRIYRNRQIDGQFKLLDCLQQVRAEKRIERRNPRIVFAIEELEPKLL